MLLLALRQLQLDKLRTAFTALVLGAAVGTILVLSGFRQGQYHQAARSVLERGAALIVLEEGASNFFDRSSLPQLSREAIEAVPGVAGAHPLTRVPVIYEQHGVRTPIGVFVIDDAGGPARIIAGRAIRGERDIVIDESVAKEHGIRVGDPFILSEFEFTVAGIARSEGAAFQPFAFISFDGMIDFALDSQLAPDISTFPMLGALLVDVEPGAEPARVARSIDASVADVAIYTPGELADATVGFMASIFGPILGLLIAIGYMIALLGIALILHVEIATRLKSFAVLKALGFAPLRLHGAVVWQTVLLLCVAFPLGLAFAAAAAAAIRSANPLFEVLAFEPALLGRALLSTFLLAVAGALGSLRSIRGADPALAFQES
jgi:putative ABC transport system permease protein